MGYKIKNRYKVLEKEDNCRNRKDGEMLGHTDNPDYMESACGSANPEKHLNIENPDSGDFSVY